MHNILLKSILIDDSAVQRAALVPLIGNHPNLKLIGEYHNGINARPYIKENTVDLIFLDIEMPVVNGFELLDSLDQVPQIIITTSNPGHALQAFDYNVTDYLLKPIGLSRFNSAVERAVKKNFQSQESEEEGEHIYVSSNLKKVKVVLKDIQWIEGMGDYIKLVTNEKNISILTTMKSFLTQLPEGKFLRIHKSYIVNLDKVVFFNSATVEICGHQLPLSRHRKDELEEALINS